LKFKNILLIIYLSLLQASLINYYHSKAGFLLADSRIALIF